MLLEDQLLAGISSLLQPWILSIMVGRRNNFGQEK